MNVWLVSLNKTRTFAHASGANDFKTLKAAENTTWFSFSTRAWNTGLPSPRRSENEVGMVVCERNSWQKFFFDTFYIVALKHQSLKSMVYS